MPPTMLHETSPTAHRHLFRKISQGARPHAHAASAHVTEAHAGAADARPGCAPWKQGTTPIGDYQNAQCGVRSPQPAACSFRGRWVVGILQVRIRRAEGDVRRAGDGLVRSPGVQDVGCSFMAGCPVPPGFDPRHWSRAFPWPTWRLPWLQGPPTATPPPPKR